MSGKHGEEDCPCVVHECPQGDVCRRWCMVDLCTKLHKIGCKLHEASSCKKMERALEKLDDFKDDLESAYKWLDDHEGKRRKSCSSRKKVWMLLKACERLRDAYEDEFKGESSDDDGGWVCMETIFH